MLTRRHFVALPLVGTLFRPRSRPCGSKLEEWRRLLSGVEGDQLEFCFEDSSGRRRYVRPYETIKSDSGAQLLAHVERYGRNLVRVCLVDAEGYELAVKIHQIPKVDTLDYTYTINF
jgi:hypothetical protein